MQRKLNPRFEPKPQTRPDGGQILIESLIMMSSFLIFLFFIQKYGAGLVRIPEAHRFHSSVPLKPTKEHL